MADKAPELDDTQRWLQSFILSPGTRDAEVDRLVLPSKTLTAAERAGVYRGMYPLRMEEALATDYPVTKRFLGDEAFMDLVKRYVARHPSRSHSLNFLGRLLPAFVTQTADLPHQLFLADLTAMELAFTEVFDEVETPAITPEEVARVPQESWATARLDPIAALRLRRFSHPVSRFKEAYREEQPFPGVRRGDQRLAIYRREYRVYWMNLTEPAFELLLALTSGTSLGEAVERVEAEEADIFAWFQDWVSNGFFQAVTSPPPPR